MPKKKERKERIPFGAMRQKLKVDGIPGYHMHWFTDRNNRILDAEAAGYEFVLRHEIERVGDKDVLPDQLDQGEKVTKPVGVAENGAPEIAYLMKIKDQWHDEDKAKKARKLDEMEQSLKTPNVESLYYPKETPQGMHKSNAR